MGDLFQCRPPERFRIEVERMILKLMECALLELLSDERCRVLEVSGVEASSTTLIEVCAQM